MIPIHTNIVTLNFGSFVFTIVHIRVYVCGVVNWLQTRIFKCLMRKRQEKFLCCKMFKLFLQSTQTRIQFVKGNISLTVQRPVRGINHQLHCSVEVKDKWNCTSTTQICLHCMQGDKLDYNYLKMEPEFSSETPVPTYQIALYHNEQY